MQSIAQEAVVPQSKLIALLDFFTLSEKMKFAIKASLSLVIVYAVSFSQGWPNATTAATTIMLIAAVGSIGDSVMKGMLRVIGTVIGAVIGMILIAQFPQDRMLYLAILSVFVTLFLYLARAYKGDMTVFMLTAITMMLMFKGGEVDNVFLYGVDKTFMTIFGISVYTLVGILLWPVNIKDESMEDGQMLTEKQQALFAVCFHNKENNKSAEQEMMSQLEKLSQSISRTSSIDSGYSASQWMSIRHNFKQIGNALTLLSYQKTSDFPKPLSVYISNYKTLGNEINKLFSDITQAWQKKEKIDLPKKYEAQFRQTELLQLSQLQRATLSSIVAETEKIHTQLKRLAEKLNALNSPAPTHFSQESQAKSSSFLWLDPEHLKGSLITFLVFWAAVFFWIVFNPPGGFFIVALATGLSVITTFSLVKPSLLMIIFTLSFIFATAMYILVLPNLVYGWQLGLFLFIYSFIGFYFINPKISIFFLLGIATFSLSNQMYYAFDIFLLVLFVFYAFLFLLLIFYYLPFSTKPEHLFLMMKHRFFTFAEILVQQNWNSLHNRVTLFGSLKTWYAKLHIMHTVQNMQLWASQIDTNYFSNIEKEKLMQFTKECEVFANLLMVLLVNKGKQDENPLIQAYVSQSEEAPLSQYLHYYKAEYRQSEKSEKWQESQHIIQNIEKKLTDFFQSQNLRSHTQEEIFSFYESLSMYKNSWRAFVDCQKIMNEINFSQLKESRF